MIEVSVVVSIQYLDKKKTLRHLRLDAPIATASSSQGLYYTLTRCDDTSLIFLFLSHFEDG